MHLRPGSPPPPAAVCEAWSVDTAKPIHGGQGTVFVGGGLVLKPVLDPHQFNWLAPVLYGLPPADDVRIIRPRPAGDGRRTVAGWSAWEYMEGEVDRARWREALRVFDRFHHVVCGVAWPPAVRGRHAWASAPPRRSRRTDRRRGRRLSANRASDRNGVTA